MRILIVSDAWHPQVNGVVRTLSMVAAELTALGHVVEVIGPDRFRTMALPTYASIRVALAPGRRLAAMIGAFCPDALHIATEGPLGYAARRWALRRGMAFTTSFHTRFPEYLHARTRLPVALAYAWLRWFHNAGSATMVATASLRRELAGRGFRNVRAWTRGVDLARFKPGLPVEMPYPRPVFLYVGRVAVEKNLGAFLSLDLPGSKLVVGDGPQREALARHHPAVHFIGERHGAALAQAYAGAAVAHRHVRAGAAREPRLRHPDRGAPGDRPGRHTGGRRAGRGRVGPGPAGGCDARLGWGPGSLPHPCRAVFLEGLRRRLPGEPRGGRPRPIGAPSPGFAAPWAACYRRAMPACRVP